MLVFIMPVFMYSLLSGSASVFSYFTCLRINSNYSWKLLHNQTRACISLPISAKVVIYSNCPWSIVRFIDGHFQADKWIFANVLVSQRSVTLLVTVNK